MGEWVGSSQGLCGQAGRGALAGGQADGQAGQLFPAATKSLRCCCLPTALPCLPAGWLFGGKVATEFNAVNSLELICRAHQLVQVRCSSFVDQPLPAPGQHASSSRTSDSSASSRLPDRKRPTLLLGPGGASSPGMC